MGPGRRDADALARELEASPRTIHRLVQTLLMANVPWYCCRQTGSYRVRQGFRFPGIDGSGPVDAIHKPEALVAAIDGVLAALGRFTEALKGYRGELAGLDKPAPPAKG